MSFFVFRIIIILPVVFSAERPFNRDYCSPEMSCNTNGTTYKHILCAFKRRNNASPSETVFREGFDEQRRAKKEKNNEGKCTGLWGKMSPNDRMNILAKHNKIRQQAVKGRTDKEGKIYSAQCMRQLRWSYVLEEAAQIYAEQCREGEPYQCAKDYVEEYQVWMNTFELWSPPYQSSILLSYAVLSWDSVQPDDKSPLNWKFNSTTAPWASLIYWETFELGCGFSQYKKDGQKYATVVCLYGPGINDIDPGKPQDLFVNGTWNDEQGCNPTICENRYKKGIAKYDQKSGRGDPYPFLCAAAQDEFTWDNVPIPKSSGPDDLEFIPGTAPSGYPALQPSVFFVLIPFWGIWYSRE